MAVVSSRLMATSSRALSAVYENFTLRDPIPDDDDSTRHFRYSESDRDYQGLRSRRARPWKASCRGF